MFDLLHITKLVPVVRAVFGLQVLHSFKTFVHQPGRTMKNNRTALLISIGAGIFCLGLFVFKYTKTQRVDYVLLIAGLFVVSLGISSYFVNPKK